MWNFCQREQRSWENRITRYGNTWKQHVQARREKWSWLTAADNDTAIFIFVFGEGQLSHSTTNHSQLFFGLNSASVTLNSVLEWSVTEEFPDTNRVNGVKWRPQSF